MKKPNKLHPLHTPELLFNHMVHDGTYFPEERRTGRTTVVALRYLATAMDNPHKWITLRDHHGTADADIHLRKLVEGMCDVLGLKHVVFRAPNYIAFGTPDGNPPQRR